MVRVGRTTSLTMLVTALAGTAILAGIRNADGTAAPAPTPDPGPPDLVPDADFARIQGAETCKDCHAPEYEAWKHSRHFQTYKDGHRAPKAKEILEKLGYDSMRSNDKCYNCHYTSKIVDGERRSHSGVSCESCHGAGANWTSEGFHHEKAATLEGGERETFLQSCTEAGMIRPSDIAAIARNCFACHTVPDPELVEKGGHVAGSDFELVTWLDGQVRHNYQYSPDKRNRSASAERRRVLYIVGAATDLEFAYRGLAKVEKGGDYSRAMMRRKNAAGKKVDDILEKVEIPELAEALATIARDDKGRLKVSRDNVKTFPTALRAAVDAFVEGAADMDLSAVDPLIPTKPRGTSQP